jgi:HSP20 family molecular chaperone IbpA
MFKKKCSNCNEKVSKNYEFCPFCGNNFKSLRDNEDYGFLGKNDFIEENNNFSPFNDSFMDKMLSNALKILETQLKELPREFKETRPNNKTPRIQNNNLDVQFFVNGEKVFPQNNQEEREEIQKPIKIRNNISEEKAERFYKLPKKEPNSKVRRLSGKIVYEIEVPGVTAIEDVLINQLENSIEIKALSKDKVYSKTLNINLPILNYKLSKGNLILELKV